MADFAESIAVAKASPVQPALGKFRRGRGRRSARRSFAACSGC
jgi:hypothetical protein